MVYSGEEHHLLLENLDTALHVLYRYERQKYYNVANTVHRFGSCCALYSYAKFVGLLLCPILRLLYFYEKEPRIKEPREHGGTWETNMDFEILTQLKRGYDDGLLFSICCSMPLPTDCK